MDKMDFSLLLTLAQDNQKDKKQFSKNEPKRFSTIVPPAKKELKAQKPAVDKEAIKSLMEKKRKAEKEAKKKKIEAIVKKNIQKTESRQNNSNKKVFKMAPDELFNKQTKQYKEQKYTRDKLDALNLQEKLLRIKSNMVGGVPVTLKEEPEEDEPRKQYIKSSKDQLFQDGDNFIKKDKERDKKLPKEFKGRDKPSRSRSLSPVIKKEVTKEKPKFKKVPPPKMSFDDLIKMAQNKSAPVKPEDKEKSSQQRKQPPRPKDMPNRPMTQDEKEHWMRKQTKEYQDWIKHGKSRPNFEIESNSRKRTKYARTNFKSETAKPYTSKEHLPSASESEEEDDLPDPSIPTKMMSNSYQKRSIEKGPNRSSSALAKPAHRTNSQTQVKSLIQEDDLPDPSIPTKKNSMMSNSYQKRSIEKGPNRSSSALAKPAPRTNSQTQAKSPRQSVSSVTTTSVSPKTITNGREASAKSLSSTKNGLHSKSNSQKTDSLVKSSDKIKRLHSGKGYSTSSKSSSNVSSLSNRNNGHQGNSKALSNRSKLKSNSDLNRVKNNNSKQSKAINRSYDEENHNLLVCGPVAKEKPPDNPWDRIYGEIQRNHPVKRPHPRDYSDYEDDEDEYEDDFIEDDDFIDDGPEGAEDISSVIRQIYKYDRRKFKDEDDDLRSMETNFCQQMKEEARSARLGRLEDLEELQKEEEEMKRKMKMKKKMKR